jgi:multimeric flavodoxin WrbA
MHIVAFNSSPRDSETSKTDRILRKFLEGAQGAGATSEIIHLRKYKIKFCLGDLTCWFKNPGVCVQPDDMVELLPKYGQAEMVVLATPVYFYTMNACMKNFLDRTVPIYDPSQELSEGEPILATRYGRMPRLVTLSVAGGWQPNTFEALSLTFKKSFGPHIVAEIYRNSSEFLDLPQFQARAGEIYQAAAQAGEEVVKLGKLQPATLAALTQDLAPPETMKQLEKEFWLMIEEQ